MAGEDNQNQLWSEINYAQENQEAVDEKAVADANKEGGDLYLPPAGDFLVRLVKVRPKEKQTDDGRIVEVMFDAELAEPAAFAVTPEGKQGLVYPKIRTATPGEKAWARNKRIAFLTRTGLVNPTDYEGLNRFDWLRFMPGNDLHGFLCTWRLGHNAFWAKDTGKLVVMACGREWHEWESAEFFASADCRQPPLPVLARGHDKLPADLAAQYMRDYAPKIVGGAADATGSSGPAPAASAAAAQAQVQPAASAGGNSAAPAGGAGDDDFDDI